MSFTLTVIVIMFVPVVVALLTTLTFVVPSRLGVRAKAIWAMALLACASRGLVYAAFGGSPQAPYMPAWLLWIWDWACSGLFFLFVFSLFWRVQKWRMVALPVLAWGLAAVGFVNGIRLPEISEVELVYGDLPEELDGYRIAQLSDLHCSASMRGWRTRRIVELVNAASPDLICLTGDNVDGLVSQLAGDLSPLKGLHAKDGVWCVRGNHEYFLDRDLWREWYAENGFRFLVNECVFPRKSLALGGVNDLAGFMYGDVIPDVAKAFSSATNGEFRVLLNHKAKNAIEDSVLHGVRLQLSGHTHGGIGPGFALLVKLCNAGFVRGLYEMPRGFLYVSPGVGQWPGFPLRFFNPPTIAVIVLRRAKQ
ncbi:MAG: metallophosphoesterase [Kiritimatiellae bacterium]|nr:metallophosphoesterase [Kiritimatiellia bacterium]